MSADDEVRECPHKCPCTSDDECPHDCPCSDPVDPDPFA